LIEKEAPILHLYLPEAGLFNFNIVPAPATLAAASAARNYPICGSKCSCRPCCRVTAAALLQRARFQLSSNQTFA